GTELAGTLSMKVLTRQWQMLLKGIPETQTAPKPLAAADMVLARLCYAADLPSPQDLIPQLTDKRGSLPTRSPTPPCPPTRPPPPRPRRPASPPAPPTGPPPSASSR